MDELVYVYDTRNGDKLARPVTHATLEANPNLKRQPSRAPVVLVDGNYRPVGYRSPNAGPLVDGRPAPAETGQPASRSTRRPGSTRRVTEPATPQSPPSAAESTTPDSGNAAQKED